MKGKSGFLSSCDRDLGFLWSFNWESGLILCLGHGTPLSSQVEKGCQAPVELRREQGLFKIGAAGESDLPSCCVGNSVFHRTWRREIRPLLQLGGNCVLRLEEGNLVFPHIAKCETGLLLRRRGKSAFLLSRSWGIGPHLKMRRGTRGSFSSCGWKLGVALKF